MAWLSDEEYIYRQDIKDKKAAGRGAFHKKGGSKSKKCNFPSDYLTKKEREAMNGEVMTYNPNAWYPWEEFKKLPEEYQVKYVNSLLNKYNCGLASISSVVFGKCKSCLQQHFREHKQLEYINAPKRGERINYKKGEAALKEAMEKDLWPNREEIQNGSESSSCEITLTGGGGLCHEEPKELTIQEKIKQAQDTVDLYESRGMPMTPELINQIYEEKTGTSFALAMNYFEGHKAEEPQPCANEIVESVDIPEMPEDSTDVSSFSIIMGKLDMGIIEYVRNLFDGKKYVVNLEVKEIKE